MTTTSKKISHFIETQIPEIVRAENPLFVSFLEAYYEFLEQDSTTEGGYLVNRLENFRGFTDVDQTLDAFADVLFNKYLALIPSGIPANRATIAKNIKDFYRSRGSEKSYRFLFHAIFGKDIDIYYPKQDILIASGGKWFVEKSVKVIGVRVNGVASDSLEDFELFTNTRITGAASGAEASVERVLKSYQAGVLVSELFLSDQTTDFENGEVITTTDVDGNELQATLVSGFISQIQLLSGGSLYNVGDQAIVESNTGTGAIIYVAATTTGNIDGVQPLLGGSGFRVGDIVNFAGGGGTGAQGQVASLLGTANSFYHANTYNVNSDIIASFANVTLNAANYGFPGYANANANTTLANALTMFSYGLTGPIGSVTMTANGSGYMGSPVADVVGNTWIKTLGVLGTMNVISGGLNYANNDPIDFINPLFCFGTGAAAKVASVNASGAIERVVFTTVPGFLPGGIGFYPDHLPTVNVGSANGTGANIVISSILGYGDPVTSFQVQTGSIGTITALAIGSPGQDYATAPTINLSLSGDGTAQAVANVVTGVFTYPGRYLDESSFLSGYSFLEDADYYQNYSYVIKVRQSIDEYRKYVKSLIHPAGMRMWGQYELTDAVANVAITTQNSTITINP